MLLLKKLKEKYFIEQFILAGVVVIYIGYCIKTGGGNIIIY